MNKKFRGKKCAYCGIHESTNEGDYVIARKFIPVGKRRYLPRVPSCKKCNNDKSKLETYAAAILPFGSNALFAKDMLAEGVPPRLDKNLKLRNELRKGSRRVWIRSQSNLIVPSGSVPLRGGELIKLLKMIIRGMAYYHWKTIIPSNYYVEVYSVTDDEIDYFRANILSGFAESYMNLNIGDGCFIYSCTRDPEDPGISAWEMSFYGARVTCSSDKGELRQRFFCGLTGPEEITE